MFMWSFGPLSRPLVWNLLEAEITSVCLSIAVVYGTQTLCSSPGLGPPSFSAVLEIWLVFCLDFRLDFNKSYQPWD